jgi:hypothetical protein
MEAGWSGLAQFWLGVAQALLLVFAFIRWRVTGERLLKNDHFTEELFRGRDILTLVYSFLLFGNPKDRAMRVSLWGFRLLLIAQIGLSLASWHSQAA